MYIDWHKQICLEISQTVSPAKLLFVWVVGIAHNFFYTLSLHKNNSFMIRFTNYHAALKNREFPSVIYLGAVVIGTYKVDVLQSAIN